MIDRTLLTEALADPDRLRLAADEMYGSKEAEEDVMVVIEAARLLLDFPTDEQVEAATAAAWQDEWDGSLNRQRAPLIVAAVLGAVRHTMIGEQ